IVGAAAVGLVVLAVCSPGKPGPLEDAAGGEIVGALSEKTFVEIGGIRQGMFIRSENPENPVILFLHGGPGSPELPMILPREKEERLEKYFTVCHWDQRAAGMSYSGDIAPADVTVERFVEDTREVTEYLRRRFGQERIILMGHSWGSYLGVKTIQKHPGLYAAYIGIGQVTDQRESERLAYDHMLARATETGDEKALEQLGKFDRQAADFPTLDYILSVRTRLMNKYRIGVTREPVSMASIAKEILFSFGGYTLGEKVKYVRGMVFSSNEVFPQVLADNLFDSARRFEIPVYVAHGAWDYQVSHALAEKWMAGIEAPAKGFFTFDGSAHSPIMEEPEKFVRTVREIVGSLPAADETD
ncbi:MAG: alpha/beta hydrolase, partial [Alistipes sp.]|nr:alpha/beta hydrolase [Alistipes sp.]